jgi:hypothetical protein
VDVHVINGGGIDDDHEPEVDKVTDEKRRTVYEGFYLWLRSHLL